MADERSTRKKRPSRAEEARARLASVQGVTAAGSSSTTATPLPGSTATSAPEPTAEQAMAEMGRMGGAGCDRGADADTGGEEESLEAYAARLLQRASLPTVQLTAAELLEVYEPAADTFLLLDALERERAHILARVHSK